mmetsp:Transcript_36866/g.54913  ORF Transcript_36866/g.54913 Transcript_36866/m.54913 type:complete len:94 (+) Transcript_36866:2-283(+)
MMQFSSMIILATTIAILLLAHQATPSTLKGDSPRKRLRLARKANTVEEFSMSTRTCDLGFVWNMADLKCVSCTWFSASCEPGKHFEEDCNCVE